MDEPSRMKGVGHAEKHPLNDDEKLCPRCAETIKKAALVCRYCSHEFDPALVAAGSRPGASAQPDTISSSIDESAADKTMRNFVVAGAGVFAIIVMIAMCSPTTKSSDPNYEAAAANLEALADAAVENLDLALADTATEESFADNPSTAGWSISSHRDEIRGSMVHTATLTSENEVEFDFPYAGGSTLQITVRKHPEYGEDVIFQISDGQFLCGLDECDGMISFDGKPETLSLGPSDDHDSKTLFAQYGEAIINKLKASNKVIVELPFYQEGNRQFTFSTKGLDWPPKS